MDDWLSQFLQFQIQIILEQKENFFLKIKGGDLEMADELLGMSGSNMQMDS
jgi:hypothetical protein